MPSNENENVSTVNETIVTGKKYRVLKDKINGLWNRISFWTSANDVEFTDSGSLQGMRLNEVVTSIQNSAGVPGDSVVILDNNDAVPEGWELTTKPQDIVDLENAVDELNDNLSGFKFYPIGTGIVGLISDDSAYTDANGKYVIWGTETANQLVADNPNTYKSVPSEEDTRGKAGADTATPFSSLEDINPTKLTSNAFKLRLGISQNTVVNMLPIQGYSSISLIKNDANVDFRISFVLKDGTESAEIVITLSWQDISIPNNTIIMKVKGHYPSMNVGEMYYALYR